MKRLLIAFLLGLPALASAQDLAITIDDLPVHNVLPPGETRLSVAERMIAALRDAKIPEPYAFVNAGPIAENPALQEVLTAWRSAGFPLGNHTWSHASLDKLTAVDFEAEITRNEAALRDSPDWHWFRYPFLIEGSDPPEDPRLLVVRGRAFAALGRGDRAEAEFARALRLAPDDAKIRDVVRTSPEGRGRD